MVRPISGVLKLKLLLWWNTKERKGDCIARKELRAIPVKVHKNRKRVTNLRTPLKPL